MENLLETQILGNSLLRYLLSFGFYLASLLALKITEKILIARIKKWPNLDSQKLSSFLVFNLEKIALPTFYFAALYFSFNHLVLDPTAARIFRACWIIVLAFQGTKLALVFLIYFLEEFWLRKQKAAENPFAFKTLLSILKLGIWSVSLIFVLDNLGFNVSAVVAGLGIGGVAVALAAQNILGDLFNYFVIFFDRPFEEGDFIVFDDFTGTIENIGIKSTRIRALDGEQIVISNSNLTNAKIRNFKRMAQRRVRFAVGVIYETPLEKLKKVSGMIRDIIQKTPDVRLDRVHFKNLGDFSLNFEAVYFVLSSDYNRHMDIQESINFAIMETFAREGIEFAYPTSVQFQKALN